jgi:hypothetical protein
MRKIVILRSCHEAVEEGMEEVKDYEILPHKIKKTTAKGSSNCHTIFASALRCSEQLIFRVNRTFIAKEFLVSFPTKTHELCGIAVLGGCLF